MEKAQNGTVQLSQSWKSGLFTIYTEKSSSSRVCENGTQKTPNGIVISVPSCGLLFTQQSPILR